MKARDKGLISLSDLPKRVRDLKKILDVYLDPSKKRIVRFDTKWITFSAHGTGYDGEELMVALDLKGRISRQWKGVYSYLKLPSETGKVLWMLKEMGYALEPIFHARAVKYYRFEGIDGNYERHPQATTSQPTRAGNSAVIAPQKC